MKKSLPWIIVGCFAVGVIVSLFPKVEKDFNARDFGRLPVLRDGRIQPLDSVGRNALRQLRNMQTGLAALTETELSKRGFVSRLFGIKDRRMDASEWLMEVMMKAEAADERKVFRIDNDEVKSLLKLPVGEKHFTFSQISSNYDELLKQGQRIELVESKSRTVFENQTYKLYSAAILYQRLKVTLRPPQTDDFTAELAEYQTIVGPGVAAVQAQQQGAAYDTNAFEAIVTHLANFEKAARFGIALCVPPTNPEHKPTDWKNMGTVLMESAKGEPLPPAVGYFAAMVTAYRQGKPTEFNRALNEYRQWLDNKMVPEVKKGREEYAFNFADLFYKAAWIYVAALLAGFVFLMSSSEWVRKSAFNLVVLAWVLHTIGLLARMYLEKRPPVTNLYSSAVFIGWVAVLVGMILEIFSRIGIGAIVAAIVGFVTQVIAINLAVGGDTMEMMRAVLDNNFWLATHVPTVTIGYSAMFVAGIIAVLYVIMGVFGKGLQGNDNSGDDSVGKILSRMIYAVVCVATLFSFVGTVLGGIWADQSWGRFWGWDPKENGALLIVIWCAVILHARWGGLVRDRGVAVLAIFGNIITAWSWFGVNMLGVGLHSYGFTDSAFRWLLIFVSSQLALIALGLLPLKWWRSFRDMPAVAESASGS